MTAPPTAPAPRRPWRAFAAVALLLVGLALAAGLAIGWLAHAPLAKADPLAATDANARGVGLMEQFNYTEAAREFGEAARLAPDWLPARLNLGMALYNSATRDDDPVLPQAVAVFEAALRDDPDNPYAHFNLGVIFKYQAKYDAAQGHFRRVVELDPDDDRARLYLGQANVDSQTDPASKRHFEKALELNPYLVPAWYALANHADTSVAEQAERLERMRQLQAANWEDEARPDKYSEQGRYATVIGRGLVKPPDTGPPPVFAPAAAWAVGAGVAWADPDDALVKAVRARFGGVTVRLDFDGDGKPDLLLLSAATRRGKLCDVLLRNTGTGFADVSEAAGLGDVGSLACAVGDYDNDGRPDLVLSSPTGLRLLRNVGGQRFEDVSAAAGFDKVPGVFLALCWLDIDQDGDLDLVAGRYAETAAEATAALGKAGGDGTGKVVVVQNAGVAAPSRGDEPTPPLTTAFKTIDVPALSLAGRVSGLVALDIDGDKDVDLVVLLDGRPPAVVLNDRLMRFSPGKPLSLDAGGPRCGLVLDANGDDQSDLLLLGPGKPTLLVSKKDAPDADLTRRFGPGATDAPALLSAQRCDLDLDGRADVVGLSADGRAVFLQGDGEGKLANRAEPFGPAVAALTGLRAVGVADFDGDGVPDLAAWSAAGVSVFLGQSNGNRGLKIALTGVRDNNNAGSGQKNLRTNTDGVGTKCRTITGPLLSMVELTTLSAGPGQSLLPLDIGIGRRAQTDAVRLRWPDCVVQAELAVAAGPVVTLREVNRKPTSCPVLMTWDGEKWVYVTDFLGGGALGESGADGSARPPRPEESVKIEPHQLGLKGGKYVLRIAEPMDEVLYLDRVRLVAVDHPADAVAFPDERFAVADPQPTQAILSFRRRAAPVSARDHRGADRTRTVATRDGDTVSDFARRSWLGFAEEHWLELDFGDRLKALPKDAPLYLVLAGWTDYPYPESILAAGQAGLEMLPPVLERQRRDGTWEKLADIGFPAGLPKVMTVPVGRWVTPDAVGKFRLRTNLQVHWDQVFVGAAEAATATELPPGRATLSHPGCVQEVLTNGRPPQAYDPVRFEAVAVTDWKGRLTKLGDVTELLADADDRLTLCGPGDELLIEFDPAGLPPLPAGWARSFVLRTRGYCKDTAPTTQTGGRVDPLPFRAMAGYPATGTPPATQAADRARWHTRPAGGR